MKNISTGLKNFMLNNPNCLRAELFTITLLNGSVILYCTGQQDIFWNGNTYPASGTLSGIWTRGTIKVVLGLESSELELDYTGDTSAVVNGIPIIQAIALGLLDGAIIKVEALYMATYGDTSNGTEIKFLGEISRVNSCGRSTAKMTVYSLVHRLNLQLPKRLIQPGCANTLFDSGCGLVKASFAVNKIVAGGSTQSLLIPTVAFSQADGYFTLGTIAMTSGANNGLTATVKIHVSGQLQLNIPLPFAVNAGDTFTAYPGCDKLQSTCSGKFSNLVHFEGEPYVPVAETAI